VQEDQIRSGLRQIGQARAAWHEGITNFRASVEGITDRFLVEAARDRIAVHEVARLLGVRPAWVRSRMRDIGFETGRSEAALSRQAHAIIERNAEILGIDIKDIDLTSPLAYLPAGKDLLKQINSGLRKQ